MPGLMWFSQFPHDGQLSIRHTCEQNDRLPKYGWLKHDGVKFGSQEIVDDDFVLTTDFVKRFGGDHGGDWTVRITGKKRDQVGMSSGTWDLFYMLPIGGTVSLRTGLIKSLLLEDYCHLIYSTLPLIAGYFMMDSTFLHFY